MINIYYISKKPNDMKQQQMYSLKYYLGKRLIETVMSSKPLPLILWKKKQCVTTHKNGTLVIEKA